MCGTKHLNPFFRLHEASEVLNEYVMLVCSENFTAAFSISFIVTVFNNNNILLRIHGPYRRHKSTKMVSYTSAHITETVFAHDQH